MLIKEYNLRSEEAAQLLCRVGSYLKDLSVYSEAKSFCQQALEIVERKMEKDDFALKKYLDELAHLFFILTLASLAELYQDQLQYQRAEMFYRQALVLVKKKFGSEHPRTRVIQEKYAKGPSANNVIILCRWQI